MICTWPQLRNFDVIAPSTALSISALPKTINGAFPPSSNASLLTPDELCLYSNFPTAVEPKNNKWRICNSYMRALLIRILTKWHSKKCKILQHNQMMVKNYECILHELWLQSLSVICQPLSTTVLCFQSIWAQKPWSYTHYHKQDEILIMAHIFPEDLWIPRKKISVWHHIC